MVAGKRSLSTLYASVSSLTRSIKASGSLWPVKLIPHRLTTSMTGLAMAVVGKTRCAPPVGAGSCIVSLTSLVVDAVVEWVAGAPWLSSPFIVTGTCRVATFVGGCGGILSSHDILLPPALACEAEFSAVILILLDFWNCNFRVLSEFGRSILLFSFPYFSKNLPPQQFKCKQYVI
uniref:Uncharacterized protein n=1 Tax=Glossina austeni TaxID=7395 RepID=A0A1A9UWL9_GLOAU